MRAGEAQRKRKFQKCIERPAGKKRLSVLKVVEASSVKLNVTQVAGSFRWKSESQGDESTRKAIRRKMERPTDLSNSLPEGIRKDVERRAGNYRCNRQ